MPTVARFNVTPVKSTRLSHPPEIEVSERAVTGDRRFIALTDERSRFSGTTKAPLLAIRTEYDRDADVLTLAFPDGTVAQGRAAPRKEPFPVALYDRQVSARPVDGRFAQALSAFCGRDTMLARVEPPEHAGGIHPVSLISLAGVDDLGRRGGIAATPDPRRFRMTIELEDADPYEEDTWAGRRVQIGEVVLRVGQPVPRCVLTTLDPDTGEHDFPTLDVLATYRRRDKDLVIGVYGDVEHPGRIRLGDAVRVLTG